MRERDLRIDLVKLIVTAMVVILRIVENTGGIHTTMPVFAQCVWNSAFLYGEWILTVR